VRRSVGKGGSRAGGPNGDPVSRRDERQDGREQAGLGDPGEEEAAQAQQAQGQGQFPE